MSEWLCRHFRPSPWPAKGQSKDSSLKVSFTSAETLSFRARDNRSNWAMSISPVWANPPGNANAEFPHRAGRPEFRPRCRQAGRRPAFRRRPAANRSSRRLTTAGPQQPHGPGAHLAVGLGFSGEGLVPLQPVPQLFGILADVAAFDCGADAVNVIPIAAAIAGFERWRSDEVGDAVVLQAAQQVVIGRFGAQRVAEDGHVQHM